jgi:hypothetical protein
VWDIANPRSPKLYASYLCIGSQSDVSVYKNLLFESTEATNARLDCSPDGVADTVSTARARGIRIYDVADIAHPKRLTTVQTCRGSHTHTVVTSPNDPNNVYIYVSGSAPVRSSAELPGCIDVDPSQDPSTERFKIEVIQVPLDDPEQAHVVSKPAILADLSAPRQHGETPADSAAMEERMRSMGITATQRRAMRLTTGPIQCHDITVYPAIGMAAGACRGYGVLLDIHDPANPRRVGLAADTNFVAWHSATFNNDGSKVLFTDEWGGGLQPRCRPTDKPEWGANAIFTLQGTQMTFQSYYKLPAPQTVNENCVAHNGSLIPIPGRDVMVQAWYQGGISVFDWTDAAHPREIAFFDRGPIDSTRMAMGGSWSVYWYNGVIVSSEIARGLDIFELTPSGFLTQNEIDAAKTVHLDYLNTQGQPHFTWPNTFALARAYVDQLARSNGLASGRIAKIRDELKEAEKASGAKRTDELNEVAKMLDSDAGSSSDAAKVRLLAATVLGL